MGSFLWLAGAHLRTRLLSPWTPKPSAIVSVARFELFLFSVSCELSGGTLETLGSRTPRRWFRRFLVPPFGRPPKHSQAQEYSRRWPTGSQLSFSPNWPEFQTDKLHDMIIRAPPVMSSFQLYVFQSPCLISRLIAIAPRGRRQRPALTASNTLCQIANCHQPQESPEERLLSSH